MKDEEWYADTMSQAIESAYEAAQGASLEPSEVLLAWIGAQLRDLIEGREPGEEWKNDEY